MRKLIICVMLLIGLTTLSKAQSILVEPNANGPVVAPYYDTAYIYKQAMKYGLDPIKIKRPEIYQSLTEWLGMPYQLGGNNIFGIDCSRFVALVYEQIFNIKLNGSSRDMFRQVIPVKFEDLQEGDLLFFARRKGGIFHVGMYLSNGKFIHASSSEGVKISDISEPYFRKNFYKGGRITTWFSGE